MDRNRLLQQFCAWLRKFNWYLRSLVISIIGGLAVAILMAILEG